MDKLKALWRGSQVKAVAIAHALPGLALGAAALLADDNVKSALQSLLTPTWFGVAMLISAGLMYLAAPHGEGK